MLSKYVKIIGPALALIGFFLSVTRMKTAMVDWLYFLLLSIGILVVAGYIIFIFIAIKKTKFNLLHFALFQFQTKKPFYLREKYAEYTFETRELMTYKKTFHIKCKQSGIREILDKYVWTKNREEKCVITPLYGDTICNFQEDAYWHVFSIRLRKVLCKNESYKTGYEMNNLQDPKRKSSPELSSGTFEATKKLHLKVVLRNPLQIKENSAVVEIYNASSNNYPSERHAVEIKEFNGGCSIEYVKYYPIKGARYRLLWEFDD